jgi:hypothetical protein
MCVCVHLDAGVVGKDLAAQLCVEASCGCQLTGHTGVYVLLRLDRGGWRVVPRNTRLLLGTMHISGPDKVLAALLLVSFPMHSEQQQHSCLPNQSRIADVHRTCIRCCTKALARPDSVTASLPSRALMALHFAACLLCEAVSSSLTHLGCLACSDPNMLRRMHHKLHMWHLCLTSVGGVAACVPEHSRARICYQLHTFLVHTSDARQVHCPS